MALTWTPEAVEAMGRAPRILRPLIRRRLEAAAMRERRAVIDLELLLRLKGEQGLGRSGTSALPTNEAERNHQIGEDIGFLAALCDQYCATAHTDAQRVRVVPVGAVTRYLAVEEAPSLCADCRKLFLHVAAKRIVCPHDPKPSCRHCAAPCHQSEYRQQMAQIMIWNTERSSPLRDGRALNTEE